MSRSPTILFCLGPLFFGWGILFAASQSPSNLDFEEGTANWGEIDGRFWALSKDAQSGVNALHFIAYKGAAANGPVVREIWNESPLPVQGGQPYTLSAFMKGLGSTHHGRQSALVRFYDADDHVLEAGETPPMSPGRAYAEADTEITVPAKARYAIVGARVYLDQKFDAIGWFRFDTFSFVPTAQLADLREKRAQQLRASYFAGPAPRPIRYDSPDAGPITSGELSIGKFYQFSPKPADDFPDCYPNEWTAGTVLTDEDIRTKNDAFDPSHYVGWRGSAPVNIVIDLGRPQLVEKLSVHGLADSTLNARQPGQIEVATRLVREADWQLLTRIAPSSLPLEVTRQSYALAATPAFMPRQAHFVRFTIRPAIGAKESTLLLLDGLRVTGKIKNTWKRVPSEGAFHGAFPTAVGHTAEERAGRSGMVIDLFEKLVGKKLAMVLWYQSMKPGRSFAEIQSLRRTVTKDFYGHRHLVIGWTPPTNLDPILHGELDAYLSQYFRDSVDPTLAEGIDAPVWFRPLNEFNGGWIPYGLKPKEFRQAWRRLYNIAEQTGAAEKHIFIWSPNHRSYPDEPWNDMRNYWPGDQYVDWVGVSAYAPSAKVNVPENRRYPVVNIQEAYDDFANYKPFMITEGGFDDNIDRVRWVREWFDGLKTKRPKVKAVIWENHNQRVISRNPEALELYRQRVQDSYWLSETWDGTPVTEPPSLQFQTAKAPTASAKH